MTFYVNPFPQHFDENGNPLAFYNVFFGEPNQDPKLFPKAPYSDEALQVPISATQVLDGKGSYSSDIFLKGSYSIRIESPGAVLFKTSPSITGIFDSAITTLSIDNVSSMIANADLVEGQTIVTRGYTNDGDGGDNTYLSRAVTAGIADGGSLIKSTGNTDIEFVGLFPGGVVTVAQFGALGNGSNNDTSSFIAALAFSNYVKVIPTGSSYIVNSDVTGLYGFDDINFIGTGEVEYKRLNGTIKSDVTVTVGLSGNFTTINAAIDFITANFSPSYTNQGFTSSPGLPANNFTVEINLLAGFIMAEQVIAVGIDLGWIIITSVDAEVIIDRSSQTQLVYFTEYAAFYAGDGANGVTIGTTFRMDTSGTATNRNGYMVNRNSRGLVLPNFGFLDCGGIGAYCRESSSMDVRLINVTGCDEGIFAANAASINAQGSTASECRRGVVAVDSSNINFAVGNAIDCTEVAVIAIDQSGINCQSSTLTGSSSDGVCARGASIISAFGVDVSNSVVNAIYARDSSKINANGSTATGSGIAVFAERVSEIGFRGSVATACTNAGVQCFDGSTIDANSCNVSGATNFGIRCLSGAKVVAIDTNAQKGGAPVATDIFIAGGAIIEASGATGGVSNTVNTVTGDGIIFQ